MAVQMVVPQVNYQHNMFQLSSLSGGGGLWLPNPEMSDAEELIATLVNSGRNAAGVVTAQKIGRDQDKRNLSWNYLGKVEWESILQFLDKNFFFSLRYYSPVAAGFISRKFYISDRTYKVFQIDGNGVPLAYVDCSMNMVDTGEGA